MDITNQIQAILNRAGNYIHGKDSDNENMKYESISEWKEESESTTTKQQWYKTGYDYYENETTCPATGKDMLCFSQHSISYANNSPFFQLMVFLEALVIFPNEI